MKIWICIDGISQWLPCNVIGNPANGAITLNPVPWGTDVISIQPNGSIQHRPQGQNGSYELFTLVQDFAYVTPSAAQSPNNCSFGFKFIEMQ